MNCPTCTDHTLVMTERAGVEIDYCPACRGVWLDRGELDKIVERSAPATSATPRRPAVDPGAELRSDDGRSSRSRRDEWEDHDDCDRDEGGHGHGRKRKRESLLSELFDF